MLSCESLILDAFGRNFSLNHQQINCKDKCCECLKCKVCGEQKCNKNCINKSNSSKEFICTHGVKETTETNGNVNIDYVCDICDACGYCKKGCCFCEESEYNKNEKKPTKRKRKRSGKKKSAKKKKK